ncbi:hypothetical protein IE077_002825, partial [Cardiosporidium cionae]
KQQLPQRPPEAAQPLQGEKRRNSALPSLKSSHVGKMHEGLSTACTQNTSSLSFNKLQEEASLDQSLVLSIQDGLLPPSSGWLYPPHLLDDAALLRSVPTIQRDVWHPLYSQLNVSPSSRKLNATSLRFYLFRKGSYPDIYRALIYRYLLQLPSNMEAFDFLLEKGKHPQYSSIQLFYSSKRSSEAIFKTFEHLFNALLFWSPILVQFSFLPALLWPFAERFGGDLCFCFELCLSILLNWCSTWFSSTTQPPSSLLHILYEGLWKVDKPLLLHLQALENTASLITSTKTSSVQPLSVLWPFLSTFMSEV